MAIRGRFGRPPDLVVESPAYNVVANGMDQFPPMQTKVKGLTSERWIRAIEIKPANPESRYVFHHANPSLKQDGKSSPLIASAVGTEGQIFPDDAGKLIKPDASVNFGMHFWPIDKDVKAVMVLGLWFYPEGERPQFETQGQVQFRADMSTGAATPNKHSREIARRGDLLIPPNGTAMYQGTYVLDKPARIHDLRGHMHVRGKYQIVEAVYPDGRREVINKLNWDHGWHTTFVYEPTRASAVAEGDRAHHHVDVRQHAAQRQSRSRPVGGRRQPDGRRDVSHLDRHDVLRTRRGLQEAGRGTRAAASSRSQGIARPASRD